MKIQLLGTGTPTPSLERMSAGYMIRIGGDVILFDHGSGAYHRMLQAGVLPTQVTHLFFSHLHYDHCVDYARLLLTRWDQGADKIPELKVYGPPFIERMTELLFSPEGVFGPDLTARTELKLSQDIYEARGGVLPRPWPAPQVTELRSGSVVEENGWTVRAISVPHAQPTLVCLAFRLDSPQGSFCYSGDCGPSKALVELAQGCDVLVHMTHYLSGTELSPELARTCGGHLEVAQAGRDAQVKNLVVSHSTEQMNVPGVRERVIREMGEIYQGNLFFGEDLMEIPLDAPQAAKLD
jgi:ribonuclease BN (tRNA processing enzyme)